MASETLELISLIRVLVLLVMRFDITSSMCKLKNRLEVPERVCTVLQYRCGSVHHTSALCWTLMEQSQTTNYSEDGVKGTFALENYFSMEASDGSCSTQYKLAGVVSHLGNSLYCGHYISHIRDFTGSGWLESSDTSIRRSSWSKASSNIGKNGYMLFYVKS